MSNSKLHQTVWTIYEKRAWYPEGSPTWRMAHGAYVDRKEADAQLSRLDKKGKLAIRKLRVPKNIK